MKQKVTQMIRHGSGTDDDKGNSGESLSTGISWRQNCLDLWVATYFLKVLFDYGVCVINGTAHRAVPGSLDCCRQVIWSNLPHMIWSESRTRAITFN